MAGSLWSLSTWLPWQLLQDSMVSADKEEEEAVPRKARLKKKEKKKKKEDEEEKKKRKTPNPKISYTILFFNLGRMLIVYSLVLQQVYCIIASKMTKLSWMPWHAGLTVSRQHHLH